MKAPRKAPRKSWTGQAKTAAQRRAIEKKREQKALKVLEKLRDEGIVC
jgi:hypothetical protein